MTSVITGDIIHSQKVEPEIWLTVLKTELNEIGENPINWDIFRGDSFQLEISDPLEALRTAIKIKASLKAIKEIDVRMAIGIGEKSHHSNTITESNGSAFVYSGEQFEQLKKERQNLAISSPWTNFNRDMNLILKLSLIIMDNWSINSAVMVKIAMENPDKSQKELGELIGIKQNAVSNRLKRAYFDELIEITNLYQTKLKELL